jgi:hypothetical protein
MKNNNKIRLLVVLVIDLALAASAQAAPSSPVQVYDNNGSTFLTPNP